MPSKQILYVAIAIVLVVAAYFAGTQRQATANARRLAGLENRQRALESGVLNGVPRAELASRLGYAPLPQASVPDERDRKPLTPEESARALQDKLAAMDRQFRAEPVDAKWAGATKASVEDSLVSAAADSGVQPGSFRTQCRSKSCMIQLEVGSGGDMDRIIEALTTEISGELPTTTMIPVTGPDGAVTLHILGTQTSGRGTAPPRG
jgi:hypothetical protein